MPTLPRTQRWPLEISQGESPDAANKHRISRLELPRSSCPPLWTSPSTRRTRSLRGRPPISRAKVTTSAIRSLYNSFGCISVCHSPFRLSLLVLTEAPSMGRTGKRMVVQSLRMTALVAAIQFLSPLQAFSGECVPTGLSSYSNLGRAMAKLRNGTSGELLAIWLLESPDPSECRFVFRVDRLLSGGSIVSMTFDARTLEQVTIENDRGWAEYGDAGQGAEAGTPGGNEGSGSNSGSGSGDDGDGDGDGDGDDSSGSGSSGSGGDSSGSGSSGSGGDGSGD